MFSFGNVKFEIPRKHPSKNAQWQKNKKKLLSVEVEISMYTTHTATDEKA